MSINNFEPVRITTKSAADEKRVPLFYVDDVAYTVPEKCSPSVFLKFMWDKKSGSEFADIDLLISVLGEDAYKALMNGNLTTEEWLNLSNVIREYAAGSMEETAKN